MGTESFLTLLTETSPQGALFWTVTSRLIFDWHAAGPISARTRPPRHGLTGAHGGWCSTLCYERACTPPHAADYELRTERHLTRESRSAVRSRRPDMSERFVVLPVSQCSDSEEQELNHPHNKQELLPGHGAGEGDLEEPQAVPILQYSREPNRYGETLLLAFYSTRSLGWSVGQISTWGFTCTWGFDIITSHMQACSWEWVCCQVGWPLCSKDKWNRMSSHHVPLIHWLID